MMTLGEEAAGDGASAFTPVVMAPASADAAHVLDLPQEEALAAAAAAVEAAAKELLSPEAPLQNEDALTTATLVTATEQLIETLNADTESAGDAAAQAEPMEREEGAAAATDTVLQAGADDAQCAAHTLEDEKKKVDEAKSWASAIPTIMQTFQEKKGVYRKCSSIESSSWKVRIGFEDFGYYPQHCDSRISLCLSPFLGASGSLLSRANWSKNFQWTITQMIAAGAAATTTTAKTQLQDALSEAAAAAAQVNAASVQQNASSARVKPEGNQSATGSQKEQLREEAGVGEKRKRELSNIDIILIDSDSDEGERIYKEARQNLGLQTPGSLNRGTAAGTVMHSNGARGAPNAGADARNTQQQNNGAPAQRYPPQQQNQYSISTGRSQSGIPTPSTSPTTASSSANLSRMQNQNQQPQVASSQSMAIEPFNRSVLVNSGLQNLGIRQVVSSSAYETGKSSSYNNTSHHGMNGTMQQQPVVEPVTTPCLPPAASMPVDVPASRQSMDGWEHISDSDGATAPPVQAPIGGMQFGNGGVNGFAMENGATGVHSMGMPSLTAIGTPATSSIVTTTSCDWTANPMEDILYDRYYQINLYTVNLEQNVKMLSDRIVQVSTQNLGMAQQLSMTLKNQQGMLQKAQLNRVNALIALIVPSHGIMKKVKRLRMDALSDIAVVVEVSHRKCVELSQQITIFANNVATLHQQMAMTLDSANAMSPDAFHQSVSMINQAVQGNEKSIRGWKEERENEIVRIVQYSNLVREELKRAFHQQKQTSASSSQQQQQQQHPQQWQHQQTSNGFRR